MSTMNFLHSKLFLAPNQSSQIIVPFNLDYKIKPVKNVCHSIGIELLFRDFACKQNKT